MLTSRVKVLNQVRELNLEIVEYTTLGIEGINCESGDRSCEVGF